MRIDAHLHVWRAVPAYPDPAITIVSPVSDVPLELLEAYLDEYSIDRAVLVQPLYPGEDNSYVADCAAAQPDRFAAVCVVDPRLPDAPAKLDYWVRERGCKGLRLRPRLPAEAACFGAPETYPLWERARALKIAINVLGSPQHLPAVGALAARFPEVPVILDHMAYPDVDAGSDSESFRALLALARHPGVYVKLSGFYYYSRQEYPYSDCMAFVRAVYEHFGPERMIWGSDFPHVLLKSGYGRAVRLPEQIYPQYFGLTTDDLRQVMGGNAAVLYWPQDSSTQFEEDSFP